MPSAAHPTLAEAFDPRSNALTVMRLALAGTVAVVHALAVGYGHQPRFAGSTLGDVAVDGFFVVSGFLVTRSLLRLPSVGRYAWHRFLRIMPGFWACLVVTALLVAPLVAVLEGRPATSVFTADDESAVDYVVQNAALLMRQFGIDGLPASGFQPDVMDGSLWTLFYEALCYGLVAFLGLLGLLRRAPWTVLAACAVLWVVTVAQSAGVVEVGTERLLRFGFVFLLGAAGHLYAHRIRVDGRLAAACLAVLVVGLVTLTDHRALAGPAFAYLCLWAAVRLPWRANPSVDVSYGLYVYHWPVQQVLALAGAAVLPRPAFVVLALALTLPLALASWYAVEAPAMRLKDLTPALGRPRATRA